MAGKSFVFTLTAGRTGTAWLAALLRENLDAATVHHEQIGYGSFGLDTPDLSTFTLFNSRGNTERVRAFWERKMARVRASPGRWYVETSHLLMKAGLVENLHHLRGLGTIHLVALERDPVATVRSYTRRGDLATPGNQWMWYLDPYYPLNILDPRPFLDKGHIGVRLWYWLEIRARQSYYIASLEAAPDIVIHRCRLEDLRGPVGARALLQSMGRAVRRVRLPPPKNVGARRPLPVVVEDRIRALCSQVEIDPVAIGRRAWVGGFRFDERSTGSG